MSKEKLIAARELIVKKQYDEARAILLTVNHPVAEQWLQKLDALIQKQNVSPAKRTKVAAASMPDSRPRRINPLQQPDEDVKPLPLINPQGKFAQPPAGNPWDPSWLVSMMFIGTLFFSAVGLSLNWRRLGKPRWMWWSLLLTVMIPILTLIGLIVIVSEMEQYDFIRGGIALVLILVLTFFVLLTFTNHRLQTGPYKKWSVEGDVEGMLNYRYRFGRAILRELLLFGMIVAGLVGLVLLYLPRNDVFTGKGIYMEYNDQWTSRDILDNENCDPMEADCVFFMTLGPTHSTSVTLYRITLDERWSLQEFDQFLLDNMSEQSVIELETTESLMINGHDAIAHTYTYVDNDPGYEMSIFVVVDETAYVLGFYAPSRAIFERNLDAIRAFYNTIEFTGDSDIIQRIPLRTV